MNNVEYEVNAEYRLDEFRKAFEKFVKNPKVCGTVDEFHGYEESFCGLWVSGEEGNEMGDGKPAFCYGAPDRWSTICLKGNEMGDGKPALSHSVDFLYEFGIHKDMRSWLEKQGFYAQWFDGGTVMIYGRDAL